jgi:two-component system, NarL family, sensor histidine kinase UhpB
MIDLVEFSKKIETLQQEFANLTKAFDPAQPQSSHLINVSLAELSTALEELSAAEEELCLQNEQLITANDEIARSEARYQHLYNYAPDSFLVTDLHGKIKNANRAASFLFDKALNFVIGKPLIIFFIQEDHQKIYALLNQLKAGQTISGYETQIKREMEPVVDVSIQAYFPEGLENEIPGVYWLLRDISVQKRLERKLADAQRELEAAQSAQIKIQRLMIDQLERERMRVSRDMHDGPLQDIIAITFDLQIAIEDSCNPTEQKTLQAIQAKLKDQIEIVRNFSRDLRPPALHKFGLINTIREYLERFHEKYPSIAVELEVIQEDTLAPTPILNNLYRIFQETMTNIVRHAKATEVKIRYEKNQQFTEIAIQDNGLGFTVPLDWSEWASKGHLGLVGMKERVEAINGELNVVSSPGKGALVQIVVPNNSGM